MTVHSRRRYVFFVLLFVFISIGSVAVFPYVNKYIRYIELGVTAVDDVEFYGRVIDQYNNAVKDAKVYYEIGGKYLSRGSGPGAVLTDQYGNFSIVGIGAILSINRISHPSIEFHHNPIEAYGVDSNQEPKAGRLIFYNYKTEPDSGLLSYIYATKETPHIFHAWRIDNNSINPNVKQGSLLIGVIADGRIYTINLGASNGKIHEGIQDGHLRVSCKRKLLETKMERKNKNDWELSLVAIDGGLQETNDYYLNSAPVSGYKDTIQIHQKASSTNYQHYSRNKRYYFTAKNKTVFGAIFINVEPFARKNLCKIALELYKFNNIGSRDLVAR